MTADKIVAYLKSISKIHDDTTPPKRLCYHPYLGPTRWNEPKPPPAEVVISCKCGKRWCCPVCGYGEGHWPCECETIEGVYHER